MFTALHFGIHGSVVVMAGEEAEGVGDRGIVCDVLRRSTSTSSSSSRLRLDAIGVQTVHKPLEEAGEDMGESAQKYIIGRVPLQLYSQI